MDRELYRPVAIGDLLIPGNLFLAPLAGFTDRGFRQVCLEHGADLTFTEMVSAEAVARGNVKTDALARRSRDERILALQLFGPKEEVFARAAERVRSYGPDIIDLNCGCPVPKVVKTSAGSALHHDPQEVKRIVARLRSEIGVPVTVKFRLGWDEESINYLKLAEQAIEGGAAMITMHARTRAQGYSGSARWEHLGQLKRLSSVPVTGSGDLFSAQDAKRMLESTGVDALMFARGAVGNPHIFSQTRALLTEGRELPELSKEERIETILHQLELCIEDKGELVACREMRGQACAYFKGIPGSAAIRALIVHASTLQEYRRILTS